jgi:hypothetical protein
MELPVPTELPGNYIDRTNTGLMIVSRALFALVRRLGCLDSGSVHLGLLPKSSAIPSVPAGGSENFRTIHHVLD